MTNHLSLELSTTALTKQQKKPHSKQAKRGATRGQATKTLQPLSLGLGLLPHEMT